MLSDTFLSTVEHFLHEHDVKPTVFGREAAGDPNFVFDLRNGRSPSLKLAQRVLDFIAARKDGPAPHREAAE